MTNAKRLGGVLGASIGVAGLAFVAVIVVRERDEFAATFRDADLWTLALAVVSGLAAMTVIGVNWVALLRVNHAVAPWRTALKWHFVGQLGKYVPGGIWPIMGPSELAHRAGHRRAAAYAATLTSMVATLIGAVIVAATSGLASPNDRRAIAALLWAGLAVGLAMIATPGFRRTLDRVAARVTKRSVAIPSLGLVVTQSLRHIPVWILMSAMNVLVVVALDPGHVVDLGLVIDLTLVTTLSWIAGFVVIGLPGGIGAREAVFVSMMSAPLGAAVAASVAVMSRAVSIIVDVLGAAVSIPVSGVQAHHSPATMPPVDATDSDASSS